MCHFPRRYIRDLKNETDESLHVVLEATDRTYDKKEGKLQRGLEGFQIILLEQRLWQSNGIFRNVGSLLVTASITFKLTLTIHSCLSLSSHLYIIWFYMPSLRVISPLHLLNKPTFPSLLNMWLKIWWCCFIKTLFFR